MIICALRYETFNYLDTVRKIIPRNAKQEHKLQKIMEKTTIRISPPPPLPPFNKRHSYRTKFKISTQPPRIRARLKPSIIQFLYHKLTETAFLIFFP